MIAASTAKRSALAFVAYKSKIPALTEHRGSHASMSNPIVSAGGENVNGEKEIKRLKNNGYTRASMYVVYGEGMK